jgi:protein-S-isoprenylcysteine O-methyltransferase Ste14
VILHNLSLPPILGSGWAYAPVALSVALLVWRTAREDRTLREELPGYEEYTRQTRYRLLPGVW